MGFVQGVKNFLNRPFVISSIILIASIVLFAQCAMTMGVTTKNRNPTEKDKAELRSVTIATLLVSLFFVFYAAMKLLCGYTPLRASLVCNPTGLLNAAKKATKSKK